MNSNKNVVLITGASSGIVRAIAEKMAAKGDRVFAVVRKVKDIEKLNQYDNIDGIELDICKSDDGSVGFEITSDGYRYLDQFNGFNPFADTEKVFGEGNELL